MAYTIPIYATWLDNILLGSALSGTTPSTSYSASTFLNGNPSQRVRYGATTITVTFTLVSSKLGEILCIPMHNFTPGSTTVVNLSNAAGLSVNIPVPALESNGFPPTLVYDFSASSNKTSGVWTLTITGNAANVIIGGAIMIYPKKTFTGITDTGSILWQVKEHETRNMIETPNEYATPYVQDYGTVSKSDEFTAVGLTTTISGLLTWFRAGYGRVRPSLFWMDPSVTTGARFGRWQKTYSTESLTYNRKSVSVVFDEWPKGELFV